MLEIEPQLALYRLGPLSKRRDRAAVDFEEGKTYLVSAIGDRVTLCGFTAEESPELEALYAEAFPQ